MCQWVWRWRLVHTYGIACKMWVPVYEDEGSKKAQNESCTLSKMHAIKKALGRKSHSSYQRMRLRLVVCPTRAHCSGILPSLDFLLMGGNCNTVTKLVGSWLRNISRKIGLLQFLPLYFWCDGSSKCSVYHCSQCSMSNVDETKNIRYLPLTWW